MKSKLVRCFFVVLSVLIYASSLSAHEFILKPVKTKVKADTILPFSIMSSHVFMISEETEPIEHVKVTLIGPNKITGVPIVTNDTLMTLDGAAKIKTDGNYLLSGHREGVIWCNTTQGWKQGSKKGLSGVVSSGKYEKFCKVLLSGPKPNDIYKKVLGDTLEIVPLTNPEAVQPGEEIAVQVLFKGKPVSTEIKATYDGFSDRPNTYAYVTEANEKGVAYVNIDHEGLWMIRAEYKDKAMTEDYDTHVLRTLFIFEI